MTRTINKVDVMSTTEISNRLGFSVSVGFLKKCGMPPLSERVHTQGSYWRTRDFQKICHAISAYLEKISCGSVELIPATRITPKQAEKWFFQIPLQKYGGGSPFWDSYIHSGCVVKTTTTENPFQK